MKTILNIYIKIAVILFLFLSVSSFAQQLPHFSQYYMNDYMLNPAVGGSRPWFEARSFHRYQWEGVTDAPRTYTLSVMGPNKTMKYGLGGYIFTDNVGPTRRTGGALSYAYHLKLNQKLKLSFGLSAGILQFMVDASKITLRDEGDNLLTNGVQSDLLLDAGFGTYLYHEKFFFGFSAPQILHNKIQFFKDVPQEGRLANHFFITGGYNFDLNNDIRIIPSIFVKYVSPVPVQYDINLRAIYRKMVWVSVAYRNLDAIPVSVGWNINENFTLAYAYDMTTTNLKNYSTGTHELMVGVKFHQVKQKATAAKME
jgi:type IX secretion system PorP/SprF family membrane protein